jgi:hypothetical protein
MENTETNHPYHDVLQAISLNKLIQWEGSDGCWKDQGHALTLSEISDEEFGPDRYRVKPETVSLNGIDIPRPMSKAPADGAKYWFPNSNYVCGYSFDTWEGRHVDECRLSSGTCWDTESGASEAVSALKRIFAA